MTEHVPEGDRPEKPLSGDDIRRIDEHIIDTVLKWPGENPFRVDLEKPWRDYEHRPDIKQRRIFASVGYREANAIALDFDRAYNALNRTPTLRLLTLRLDWKRPAPDELEDHIVALLKAYSGLCDSQKRGNKRKDRASPTPVLSALHLRLSDVGQDRLDPHIHCIWEIADDDLSATISKMERAFGQVWLDSKPVQKPRHCAFYLCAGVVNYSNVEGWPDAALRAVWNLSAVGGDEGSEEPGRQRQRRKFRLIRRAGWFLSQGNLREFVEDGHGVRAINASKTSLEDAVSLKTLSDVPVSHEHINGAQNSPQEPIALNGNTAWHENLFKMLSPIRPSQWQRLTTHTVRNISTDKKNLLHYPTLGEMIAVAILIIESEQRDFDRYYQEVLDAYGLDERQMKQALVKVEAYFRLTLIHPGEQFIPTSVGVKWAVKIYRAVEPIREMLSEGRKHVRESVESEGRLEPGLQRSHHGKV